MDADKEIVAVDTVSLAIAASGNFKPDIKKNDKLPSWDGEIYVYLSKKKEKRGLYDVIPVQVKGTERDSRIAGGFKYSVQTADLRNFLECRSGTTLFFVVYIHEGKEETICDIYYEKFLPFDLKHILKEYENQDTVTITFRPFPKKKKERARIIYDIVRDMKRQRATIAADTVTVETILKESSNPILNVALTIDKEEDTSTPFFLLGRDYYFYTKRQDNILQPVMHGRIDGISIPIQYPVLINGIEYYSMYERVEYSNCIVFKIGESIEFVLPKDDSPEMKLRIHTSWKLSEDIRDITFLLKLIEHKEMSLGEIKLPCNLTANSKHGINIDAMKQHLESCQMIQKLMSTMDVSRDFDLAQVKENQWAGLCRLYGFIIEENKARIEFQSDYGIIEPEIGNLKILLFAIADKQNEHCYEIRSFSDTRNIVTDEDGHQTSPFVGLSVEQILHIDNIKYENFFQQLEIIPLSERFVKEVTHLFYKLLLAYDKSGDKRTDILTHAVNLAEWLEKHDQTSDQIYKTLNKLEALKRSRQLTEQENEELFSIAEHTELPPIYRSLAYMLLGEQKSAERFFKQEPADIQSAVREYPIFRFWKGKTDKKQSFIS